MSPIIEINNLSLKYASNTSLQRSALRNVSLTINKGEFHVIIGSQGSGKSTLLQVMAGLLVGEGCVKVCGKDLNAKSNRTNIWRNVGLIFQYPERQLFEDTVWNDVAYGPKNLGLPENEVNRRVSLALKQVNLGEDHYQLSPFKLSGGQQRRASIAGVLAMEPEVLLLDEPTAGLDPKGKKQLMDLFEQLCREKKVTVILVTHDMEEVANRADRVTILSQGKVALKGTPKDIFSQAQQVKALGLSLPFAAELSQTLLDKGLAVRFTTTLDQVQKEVETILKKGVISER